MATLLSVSGMATRTESKVAIPLVLVLRTTICEAASVFHPISDTYPSATSELFTEESLGSLEEAYEALRSFEVLGIDKPDIPGATCESVVEKLGSSASAPKDLFYALKVNSILKGEVKKEVFEGIASRLKAVVNGASSLLDIYYSIGGLVLIKDQTSEVDVLLADADGIFRSIKSLSQSDGRWCYSSDNSQSSTYAAGLAIEALAGVVSLASSEIDQSMIVKLNRDVSKLFDSVEKYDDGAFYFDEKVDQSPLSTAASVVRGLTALAAVTSEKLKVPGEKILGLAKFFLGIGIPGNNKDFFNQIDSLASLESNNVSVPLILSLPTTVLSLTKKDQLKVKVSTVLGSSAPPLTVRLVRAFSSDSKDASIIASQELKFDKESGYHVLDVLPKSVGVGSYIFVFEVVPPDFEDETVYTTGGLAQVGVFVSGVINIEIAEISVLESDKSVETQKKLDLAGENAVSLSAIHLQKLRLSFQLTIPLGHAFKPHQVFHKLTHETKVEHMFEVGYSGKKFEKILDFLGLVDKFYYLSGSYDFQLTVGGAAMESSFLRGIGHIDLDLPEAPEMATRPPLSSYILVSLSQSDGRWHDSSDNPQSSTYAAGLAIEAIAGVVSLASSEIDQSMGNVAVVLKVQREHMIISYTDVQRMHSFPVMQMKISTKVKREARPPYGGDNKDKVDMGPAVNVYRITADAMVHEIGEIHPLSYNGDSYGLHNAVLSIVQAHISSGGLFGYATPTLQQFEIVYYHDPHREDGTVIRLNCPELEMPYYYFSSLLSGVAICNFDPVQFLVP